MIHPFQIDPLPTTNLPASHLNNQPGVFKDMALNDGRPPDAAVGGGWRSNQATKTSQGLHPGGKGETSTQTNHEFLGFQLLVFGGVMT